MKAAGVGLEALSSPERLISFICSHTGLSVVLVFVGLKIVWLKDLFGGNFPISFSLGFIGATIFVLVIASLLFPKTVVVEV